MLKLPQLIGVNNNYLDAKFQLSEYKLDWTGFEKLPDPYEDQIQNLHFAMTTPYVMEAKRNAQTAKAEWSMCRPFDTVIREACLKPAIAHVDTYFMLIWDCVFNDDYQDYSLSYEQSYLRNAMVYKMWLGQTGLWCAHGNAQICSLEATIKKERKRFEKAKAKGKRIYTSLDVEAADQFVKTMDEFKDNRKNFRKQFILKNIVAKKNPRPRSKKIKKCSCDKEVIMISGCACGGA